MFYPKNFSDLFTLSPSASCFAPSAVILLFPRLLKTCLLLSFTQFKLKIIYPYQHLF